MERYFYVVAEYPGGVCSLNFITYNGEYLNKEKTKIQIAKYFRLQPLMEVVITNIIELSEADFKVWSDINNIQK